MSVYLDVSGNMFDIRKNFSKSVDICVHNIFKHLRQMLYTEDYLYLDYSLSQTSPYFEQKARSLGDLCTL